MSGRILTAARQDVRKIISKIGFEENVTLSTPNGELLLELKCIHTKHNLGIDVETGAQIRSKNAHVTISEQDLIDAIYPYRNIKTQEVNLENHIISAPDSSGSVKKYVILSARPSETFGVIVCILGDSN